MPAEILLITRSMIMKDIIIMLGIAGVWILLQTYILPKLGISTWLKDSCQVTSNHDSAKESEPQRDKR